MFTKAGQLAARDNRSGLRDSTDDVVRFVQYLSIPAAIVLGFLAGPTIEAWLGPVYLEAAPIIGLLCIAAVIQAWAVTLRTAVNGSTGRPTLAASVYGAEAVIHVALGIALASRYGPLGMAEAVLIGVVLMEGMLMLPLAYRTLGDSFPRRALRAVRSVALPGLVTGCRHGRILGLTAVVAVGVALMIVFYALLLACLPSTQRHDLIARSRASLSRFTTRPHRGLP